MEDLRKIPAIRNFLLDIKIYDVLEGMVEKYNIPEERVRELLDLSDGVIKGKANISTIVDIISKAFDLDKKVSEEIARDLIGYQLLPLESYLPGVKEEFIRLGGKEDDYPGIRIEKERESAGDFITKFAADLGLELPEHLMKRFIYSAKGYLLKDRAREATVELMMRRLNIGGLEMTKEQAENALKMLDDKKDEFREAIDEVEHVEPTHPAGNVNQKTPSGSPLEKGREDEIKPHALSLSGEDQEHAEDTDKKTEVTEIKDHRRGVDLSRPLVKEVKKEVIEASKEVISTDVKKEVEEVKKEVVVKKPPVIFDEVKEVKGEEGVISTDVEKEVKEVVQEVIEKKKEKVKIKRRLPPPPAPPQAGGEARLPTKAVSHALTKEVPIVSGDILDEEERKEVQKQSSNAKKVEDHSIQYYEHIEHVVKDLEKRLKETFKKKRITAATSRQIMESYLRGIRDTRQTERLLQDRYKMEKGDIKTVIKTLKEAEADIARSFSQDKKVASGGELVKKEKELLNTSHAALTKKIDDKDVESVLPQARVSAARSKEDELKNQESRINKEDVKKAKKASRPPKARTLLSVQSVAPDSNEKVTDVKFARKLVGPVEELGKMSPSEFRRLSSDPTEAARKVEDKIELLEATSYEERIKGVRAWRRSTINKLYLQMTHESLKKGISIAEIASQRRNAGEESLSPVEITAIVALNNRIKF